MTDIDADDGAVSARAAMRSRCIAVSGAEVSITAETGSRSRC